MHFTIQEEKRASAAVGDSNEEQTNVEKEYELKGIMILILGAQTSQFYDVV